MSRPFNHRCAACGKALVSSERRSFGNLDFCSLDCFRLWDCLSGEQRWQRLTAAPTPRPASPPPAAPPPPPPPAPALTASPVDSLPEEQPGFVLKVSVPPLTLKVKWFMLGSASMLVLTVVGLLLLGYHRDSAPERPPQQQAPGCPPPHRGAGLPATIPRPDPFPTKPREPVPAASSQTVLPPPIPTNPLNPEAPPTPKSLPPAPETPVAPVAARVETSPPPAPGTAIVEESELVEEHPAAGRGLHGFSRGRADIPNLALTFDGTWDCRGLESILATLSNRRVKATFFLSGPFLRSHPDQVRQIVQSGHEVGNHLYSHVHLTTYGRNGRHELLAEISRERFLRLLKDNEALFRTVTGREMARLWRAPFGETNPTLEKWAAEAGYTHVSWTRDARNCRSMDSLDWVADPRSPRYLSARQIQDRITGFDLGRQGGANGAIILMHVGTQRKGDFAWDVLDDVIDRLRAKGYEFVPASRLAPLDQSRRAAGCASLLRTGESAAEASLRLFLAERDAVSEPWAEVFDRLAGPAELSLGNLAGKAAAGREGRL